MCGLKGRQKTVKTLYEEREERNRKRQTGHFVRRPQNNHSNFRQRGRPRMRNLSTRFLLHEIPRVYGRDRCIILDVLVQMSKLLITCHSDCTSSGRTTKDSSISLAVDDHCHQRWEGTLSIKLVATALSIRTGGLSFVLRQIKQKRAKEHSYRLLVVTAPSFISIKKLTSQQRHSAAGLFSALSNIAHAKN